MRLEDDIRAAFDPIGLGTDLEQVRRSARRRRRVRRSGGTLAVAAVITAMALVLPTLGAPDGAPMTAAAKELHTLALVASRQPKVAVGPDQFVYSRISARWQSCYGNDCTWELSGQEFWVALDGSGRMAGYRGDRHYSEIMGAGELKASLVTPPPTDVEQLRAYIQARAEQADQPLDYEMFVVVSDLLRETLSSPIIYAEPELRSSLFEVASTLPGVEALGTVTDESGRSGVGVGFVHGQERLELIFDPQTSQILGMREVSVESGRTVPGSWIVFETSAVVNDVHERP